MTEDKKPAENVEEVPARPQAPARSHTKVTKMNLKMVESAIQKAQDKMGGLQSRYGQSLLEQRARLRKAATVTVELKKAA